MTAASPSHRLSSAFYFSLFNFTSSLPSSFSFLMFDVFLPICLLLLQPLRHILFVSFLISLLLPLLSVIILLPFLVIQ
jgi:hypothetical protein